MLTEKQAKFLNAACATDATRCHLTHPWVAKVDGVQWLVATDGHRLHAVRAPEKLDIKGWCVADRLGQVYGLTGKASTPPPLPEGVWMAKRATSRVDRAHISVVAAARAEGLYVAFGHDLTASVHCRWNHLPDGSVAVQSKLVTDALSMAAPSKTQPAMLTDYERLTGEFDIADEGDGEIAMSRGGAMDPVVFEHAMEKPLWRAVVMPVRT